MGGRGNSGARNSFTFGNAGTYTLFRAGEVHSENRPISFARTEDYAKTYRGAERRAVEEYEVEIKNPYTVTVKDEYPDESFGFVQAYNQLFNTSYSQIEDLLEVDSVNSKVGKKRWLANDKKIMKELVKRGYDALIYNVQNKYHFNDVSEVLIPAQYRDRIKRKGK